MTRDTGPLQLAEILQASEAVRIATIATLANQCKRLSSSVPVGAGRSRPTSLLPPVAPRRQRVTSIMSATATATTTAIATSNISSINTEKGIEDDVRTVYRHSGSNRSPFQSEPPSPPPTPKMIPDDLQSTCTTMTTTTMTATTMAAMSSTPHPKASVFSVFCPEAMRYQVDVRKAMPPRAASAATTAAKSGGKCKCGYDWYGWLTATTTTAAAADGGDGGDNHQNLMMIKDGFQLTPRFLGKSHCEGGVFGCVLCTSSGKTETYADANALRAHINAAHTKWQMLHDSDMAGRLGVAAIM